MTVFGVAILSGDFNLSQKGKLSFFVKFEPCHNHNIHPLNIISVRTQDGKIQVLINVFSLYLNDDFLGKDSKVGSELNLMSILFSSFVAAMLHTVDIRTDSANSNVAPYSWSISYLFHSFFP